MPTRYLPRAELQSYIEAQLFRAQAGAAARERAQAVKANVLFFERKPASETLRTEKLWIYDLRTNQHYTPKANPLGYEDLQDFVQCYDADNRHERQEMEQFRALAYGYLVQRDKVDWTFSG